MENVKETKKILIGVQDRQIGIVNIFTVDTEGQAIREMEKVCTAGKGNDFEKFPDDFVFVKLGELTIETGKITLEEPIKEIVRANQFKKKEI